VFRFEAEHTVSSPGGELRGVRVMVKPAAKISYSVLVRGLAGSLSLEDVRRSPAFEELLVPDVNPVPTEFDLGEFVGGRQAMGVARGSGLPEVPVPSGSFGNLSVDRPSVVEQGVAAARAERFGRPSSAVDLGVAGSGRG
jgi:hypothetical protein